MLSSCLPTVVADTVHWVGQQSGFYENADAWVPAQVPDQTSDHVIFGQPLDLSIGLLQNHTLGELQFANQTNVRLLVAGGTSSGSRGEDRYLAAKRASVDDATLTLGNANDANDSDVHLEIADTFDLDGQLVVSDGSRLSSHDLNLGKQSSRDASMMIRGVDSMGGASRVLVNTIKIGHGAQASVEVTDGAELRSHIGYVGRNFSTETDSMSRAVIQGANDGTASRWNATAIVVGSNAAGRLTAGQGGIVDANSLVIGTGPDNEPANRGFGMVDVVGVDALGNSSTLNVDIASVGVYGSAYLSVIDGGHLQSRELMLAKVPGSNGHLLLHSVSGRPVSRWTNQGDAIVGGDADSAGGTATLDIRDNSHVYVLGELKLRSDANVLLDGGKLSASRIAVDVGADFQVNSGILEMAEYEGAGMIQRGGRLAPGPGTARTSILSDLTQRGGAITSIDIGGTTAGETYDRISVDATALIDGLLEVTLVNHFVPDRDDLFTVVTANNLFGAYQNVLNGQRVLTYNGNASFVVSYGHQSPYGQHDVVLSDFRSRVLGDFDFDGELTAVDIDRLSFRLADNNRTFDLNDDGRVDGDDRSFWVSELANTYFGDADLNGEFDSSDLVQVFMTNKYEDGVAGNAGWSEGDWNGDGDFDSTDFVFVFRANGYEAGPRANFVAVPEPGGIWLAMSGLCILTLRRLR